MTPREAELLLRESKKRRKKSRGPAGLGFTIPEKQAVRIMTHHRRTQAQIADMVGLGLRAYHKALESDEQLAAMQQLGRDDRLLEHAEKLEKIAKKDTHRGQMRALELLLKMDGQIGEARERSSNELHININANVIPQAIDGRKYAAIMKRIQTEPANAIIEHEPQEVPKKLDPIAAVREKQRQERVKRV
jgi:hypothetical protein